MQINSPLEKGFALVVIVLFIGASIIPLTGSKSVEKPAMPTLDDITIVSIQPSNITVGPGETFEVFIWIEPSEPIIGAYVECLYFDPTLIYANWIDNSGGLFDEWVPYLWPDIDNDNGEIRDILGFTFVNEPATDPGYLCYISFIAQQEIGTSLLDLQNVLIADENGQLLPSTVIDGEVNVGKEPPQITNVMLTTSDPLDTDPRFGWENFSCTVTSDGTLDVVQLNLTYTKTYFPPDPWKFSTEYFTFPMNNIPGTDVYYYHTTLTAPGEYTYHIWANDTNGNQNSTAPETFFLPMNEDVTMDGKVAFMDLIAVARRYGDVGPPGWCREDIDNNGKVYFMDLIFISLRYEYGPQ